MNIFRAFRKLAKKRRIAFLLGFFVFLCLMLETLSRAAISFEPVLQYMERNEFISDFVWRNHWVKDHIKEPGITYEFDIHDALKGWRLRPNINSRIVFDNKILNTNSRGIRGEREYSYGRVPGKLRILVLGDSFTFGEGVSDNETYSFFLEKLIPDSEVINLGGPGYGHDQMLLYLNDEGVKYKPDIVLLGYHSYDDRRNMLRFRDFAKPMFVLKGDKLVLINVPVPSPYEVIAREFWRPKFFDLLNVIHRKMMVRSGRYQEMERKVTRRILGEIVDKTREINAVPVFVYLGGSGSYQSVTNKEKEREFFDHWQNKGVACAYLGEYFYTPLLKTINAGATKVDNYSVREREYHSVNPDDHAIIAVGIRQYLIDNDLISPGK